MRTLGSRIADAFVLVLGLASVLALAEMAVRPFYAAPPVLVPPQVSMRYSPRLGWEMSPDGGAHSLEASSPINERSLRGDLIPYEQADSTARRWLLLGGGSAFGVGVPAEEICLERARVELSSRHEMPVEIVSGACEGYDLYQSVRWLELEGRRYRPDAIVLLFEFEDLPRTGVRDSVFSGDRFNRLSAFLNRKPDPDPDTWDKLRRSSRLVHFVDGRVRSFLSLGQKVVGNEPSPSFTAAVRPIDLLLGRDSEPVEAAWRTVDGEFARIAAGARGLGAQVYVVALPLSPQLRRPYPRARYQSRLRSLCEEHGFEIVDPLSEMREARRELLRLYLPRLPYLNANGHRILGGVLTRELESALLEAEPVDPMTGNLTN